MIMVVQSSLPHYEEVLSVIWYVLGVAAYRAKIVVFIILYVYVHLNKIKKIKESMMQWLQVVLGLFPAWYPQFLKGSSNASKNTACF